MFEVDSWDIGSENEEKLVRSLFGDREVGNKQNPKNIIHSASDKKRNIKIRQKGSLDIENGDGEVKSFAAKPKKRESCQLGTGGKNEQDSELPKSKKRKKKSKNKIEAENDNTIGIEMDNTTIEGKEESESSNNEITKIKCVEQVESTSRVEKKKKKTRKSKQKLITTSETIDESFESSKNIAPKQSIESHTQEKSGTCNSDASLTSFQKSVSSNKPKELTQSKQGRSKKSELQEKLKQKLESSRFRWINEQLYTIPGDEALSLFKDDTSLFDVYHQGFRRQVEQWPVNPVDVIIDWIKQRSPSLVLADFGCGEAVISQSVPNKVHSFDLVAVNDRVTACNMAKVPLESGSVDVAIFCLSLMGTDLESFLREAHRVLKPGGILKIAEVVSRMDTNKFIPALCQLGFKLDNMDNSNKMFVLLDVIKVSQSKKSKEKKTLSDLNLKPCIYKRR